MSISERKHREKAFIKEQIVNAATELFSLYGYEHVSMRKIADKIEYSPTTIYNYFKNKNELLFELLKQGYELFYQTLDSTYQTNKKEHFDLKFKSILSAYIEFGLSHKDYYKLMFISNIDKDDSLMGVENERAKAFEILISLVREGTESNYFIHPDERLISQMIWGQLHGITSLLITYKDFPWVQHESLIDHYLESVIKGVKNGG
ncbi:TetR/AcrR family transcriptional regulator [Salsuginibacillus kocurii]|uniref:TetR/AcrR family transcriptional regulator n=1 Tax=Salsuginibacillus kocurii TaxID=427078 RepID=UPI0003694782|nr:TetR/AcrR family transcriptional regulator [Salsuginibacillus kocurii]